MIRIYSGLLALLTSAYLLMPDLILASGEKADMLVVVADSRRVSWSVSKFFLDVYNSDPYMFGLYCAVLTAALGCVLGLITDFFMKRTGIDLTSRKIVEH
jgi:ABC-type Fe3+ transport system permease subunit